MDHYILEAIEQYLSDTYQSPEELHELLLTSNRQSYIPVYCISDIALAYMQSDGHNTETINMDVFCMDIQGAIDSDNTADIIRQLQEEQYWDRQRRLNPYYFYGCQQHQPTI